MSDDIYRQHYRICWKCRMEFCACPLEVQATNEKEGNT